MASVRESSIPYQEERFEEHLRCPICFEVFRSPRALSCLHTFCEKCITSYIVRNAAGETADKQSKGNITCPTCRQITKVSDTSKNPRDWGKLLPLNYTILPLIEAFHNKIEVAKNCVSCSDTVHEFFAVCEDCAGNLCAKCIRLHTELKVFKDHDIKTVDLDSEHGHCHKHVNKKLDYFCQSHDELLCSTCAVVSHRTCVEIKELRDIATDDKVRTKMHEVKNEVAALQAFVYKSVNNILMGNDQLIANAAENNEKIKVFKKQVEVLTWNYEQLQLERVHENEDKTQIYFIHCQKILRKVQTIEKILDLLENCTQKTSLYLALDGFLSQINSLQNEVKAVTEPLQTDCTIPPKLGALISLLLPPPGNVAKVARGRLQSCIDDIKCHKACLDPAGVFPKGTGDTKSGGTTVSRSQSRVVKISNITQKVVKVDNDNREKILLNLLTSLGPGILIILFVDTKDDADALEEFLLSENYPVTSIHCYRSQRKRDVALKLFRTGERPILVTHLVAQTEDFPKVHQVVNFDFPSTMEEYTNRMDNIDPTANTGLVTSFFSEKNKHLCRDLIHKLVDSHQEVPSWLESLANTARPAPARRILRRPRSQSCVQQRSRLLQGYHGNQQLNPLNQQGSYRAGTEIFGQSNRRLGAAE